MSKEQQIREHPTYISVMKDSFGGVLYDVNSTFDRTDEVLAIWDSMTPVEQESVGGVMKGAISFLKGDN